MCPVRVLMRYPLDILHTIMVLSQDPEIKYSSFGEKTTVFTYKECPVKVLMSSPVDTFHRVMVLSQDAETKYSPLDEKTMLLTCPVCLVSWTW